MSSTSSSASSPERFWGRGRSRGSRGGRVRAGVRSQVGQSTTVQSLDRASAALEIIRSRKDQMKSIINDLTPSRMQGILFELVEIHPSLIFNIIEPTPRQPGGYHPPGDGAVPGWCVCLKCRQMPSVIEKICCEREFQVYILDEGVLALSCLNRQDLLVLEDGGDILKANRQTAYRQFVLWHHGHLGTGNRIVIPSCCIWAIRDKFPDTFVANYEELT